MNYKVYYRICLFIPLLVPLPLLLLKGDGFHAVFISTLVFGMPPYVLFVAFPLAYFFGQMSEKQIVKILFLIPIALPIIFGLFWTIVPYFITSVSISLVRHSEWILITFVTPLIYASLYVSTNILRKKLFHK